MLLKIYIYFYYDSSFKLQKISNSNTINMCQICLVGRTRKSIFFLFMSNCPCFRVVLPQPIWCVPLNDIQREGIQDGCLHHKCLIFINKLITTHREAFTKFLKTRFKFWSHKHLSHRGSIVAASCPSTIIRSSDNSKNHNRKKCLGYTYTSSFHKPKIINKLHNTSGIVDGNIYTLPSDTVKEHLWKLWKFPFVKSKGKIRLFKKVVKINLHINI